MQIPCDKEMLILVFRASPHLGISMTSRLQAWISYSYTDEGVYMSVYYRSTSSYPLPGCVKWQLRCWFCPNKKQSIRGAVIDLSYQMRSSYRRHPADQITSLVHIFAPKVQITKMNENRWGMIIGPYLILHGLTRGIGSIRTLTLSQVTSDRKRKSG